MNKRQTPKIIIQYQVFISGVHVIHKLCYRKKEKQNKTQEDKTIIFTFQCEPWDWNS